MHSLETGFILIVDDNATNLSVLSKTLKTAGFKVRVAVDGESAIEQVKDDPPELILLDILMPGLDGFETCTMLKNNIATRDIPVIFLTALSETQDKIKGLSVGAVDYITKPFQEEEVLARVIIHLKLRSLTKTVIEQAAALQKANQYLQLLANLDGLTQIPNRRQFDEYLNQEWRRLSRENLPLSLILCDIDYFKHYNDYYGHLAGDTCLKEVAQAIERAVKRPADLVARYGGEEFAVIMPNTNVEGAIRVAELIQVEIQMLKIPHAQSNVSAYITLTLGISSQVPTQESQPKILIDAADQALYAAKRQGRDTHCVHNKHLPRL